MSDIKMFIQYHAPLPTEYQELYGIIQGEYEDYYNYIKLNANIPSDDPFLKTIQYKDNIGENISNKNYSYVDVTALYQYQKNIKCDIIGNNHYSKYFFNNANNNLITKEEIEDYLKEYDFIVHIGTLPGAKIYDIYKNFHGETNLNIAGDVIKRVSPEYYQDFVDMINGEDSTLYNMMICHKDDFDAYCEQLFKILFECEKYAEVPDDDFQRKVFGFLGERLLLVQLKHNKKKYIGSTSFTDSMKYTLEKLHNK